ncbi:MAG: hypothetical protein FK734_20310, partial [Asgard group archaeon]|nr:hypothetical protein [Asgard group archaeon]
MQKYKKYFVTVMTISLFLMLIIISSKTISVSTKRQIINTKDLEINTTLSYPDLNYSTYLGGSDTDSGFEADIALSIDGCSYVIGDVNSTDFPILNAFDDSFNGGV